MNIRFGNKQNLVELAEDLREITANKDQPAPYSWDKIRQLLEDNALYLEQYIIPRTPEEDPSWKGNGLKIAAFVPPERADLEVTLDESVAGTPFLPEPKL
jgi:hypothetical protein